jgi:fucokinase
MMDLLEPHAFGQALAGAGGGGFMYVISKEPNASEMLERIIRENIPDATDILFHKVEIDSLGLHTVIQ